MGLFATIQTRKVFVSPSIPFALYESSGENSEKEGTIFPFFGISIFENSVGKFLKPDDIFDLSYINFAWSKLNELIEKIEDTFSPNALYAEAHELMIRFGTPQLMCLSAAIGGGVWKSENGKKLRSILEATFDMTQFIRTNEAIINEVQQGISKESFAKDHPVFLTPELMSPSPGKELSLEQHFAKMGAIRSTAHWIMSNNAHLFALNSLSNRPEISLQRLTKKVLCFDHLWFLKNYCTLKSVQEILSSLDENNLEELITLTYNRYIPETLYLAPAMADEKKIALGGQIKSNGLAIVLFDDNTVCLYDNGMICLKNNSSVGVRVPHRAELPLSSNVRNTRTGEIKLYSHNLRYYPPHELSEQTLFLRLLAEIEPSYVSNCGYFKSSYRILYHKRFDERSIAGSYLDPKQRSLFADHLTKRPVATKAFFEGIDFVEPLFRNSIIATENAEAAFFHELKPLININRQLLPSELIQLLHEVFEQGFFAWMSDSRIAFNKKGFFQADSSFSDPVILRDFCEEQMYQKELLTSKVFSRTASFFQGPQMPCDKSDGLLKLAEMFCTKIWPILDDFLMFNSTTEAWYSSLNTSDQAKFRKTWEMSIQIEKLNSSNAIKLEKLKVIKEKLPLLITILQNNPVLFKTYSASSRLNGAPT